MNDLLDREYFGMKLGLRKIRRILSRLDHPEEKFSSIHIAGTNGKGSTATMVARILEAGHYRVGLFTSPHLQQLNERFQINGEKIASEELDRLAEEVQAVDEDSDPLSFFEFITVMAFLYFAHKKVDVAVIEVGLGGRLDATNVIQPDVSVITGISLDHQRHLGSTLEKIATEKAGIIKTGIPVFSSERRPHIRRVLSKVARQKKTKICFIDEPECHNDGTFSWEHFRKLWVPMLGNGQALNAALAVAVAEAFLQQHAEWPLLSHTSVYRGLASAMIPGRMEIVHRSPFVFLDGAHNEAAVDHLVATCRKTFKKGKIHCLFGAMGDKDFPLMLKRLHRLGGELHVTAPKMKRAVPAQKLVAAAASQGWPAQQYKDCRTAVRTLLGKLKANDTLVVTGSLFLVGEARACFTTPALAS